MGHVVIATPELMAAAALAAGSAAPALPVSNLLTNQPGQVWRATDLGAAWVEADLGASAAVNLIALLYTNASGAAAWRIRAAATQGELTTAPPFDTGSVTLWPTTGLETWPFIHALHWLGTSPQTRRWWRVDVTDPANPGGFFQAGRLYLANAWQPTRNLQYGWSLGWETNETAARSRGGALYPETGAAWRVVDFELGFEAEAEMYDNAFALQRRRATSGDVLAIRDPDAAARQQDQTVYGLMEELPPIVQRRFKDFRTRFRITEQL